MCQMQQGEADREKKRDRSYIWVSCGGTAATPTRCPLATLLSAGCFCLPGCDPASNVAAVCDIFVIRCSSRGCVSGWGSQSCASPYSPAMRCRVPPSQELTSILACCGGLRQEPPANAGKAPKSQMGIECPPRRPSFGGVFVQLLRRYAARWMLGRCAASS